MICIIDYGAGNLGSILNMLKKVGASAKISSGMEDVMEATKLILPGVGSFDSAMSKLDNMGLIPVLRKKVQEEKIPILGICLGMQLFTKGSEEGVLPGLGWFDARMIKFNIDQKASNRKVPHMGWNDTRIVKPSKIFKEMFPDPRFYYVHSYHLSCENATDILTTAWYEYEFASALEKDNIVGVQFHPEKSHKFGMQLMKNFVEHY